MQTGFAEMSSGECRERIAKGGVGRLAMCTRDGPQVFPVSFVVADGDIVFRTSPYTSLGAHIDGSAVAFEIDEFDLDDDRGWSVVVHGEATAVTDVDELMELRRSGPQPMASGARSLVVRVHPHRFTGRLVGREA